MIVGTLIRELMVLILMLVCGYVLAKIKLVKSTDSRVLSIVSVYLVVPCALIKAFQIHYSDEIRNGFFLALAVATVAHIIYIILIRIFSLIWHMEVVEQMSIIYTNGGTLVMALVMATFGEEWVIYSSAYSLVQTFFIWTHGYTLIRGIKVFDLKKILLNVNLIAAAIGFSFFVLHVRLPELINTTIESIGSMLGTLSMLMIGMVIGGSSWKESLGRRNAYWISFLRLIAVPALTLSVIKGTGIATLVPDGETILLISMLSIAAPAGLMVTQLAQIYENDVVYASSINVLTTILSVFTLPLWTMIYYAF